MTEVALLVQIRARPKGNIMIMASRVHQHKFIHHSVSLLFENVPMSHHLRASATFGLMVLLVTLMRLVIVVLTVTYYW